MCVKIRNDVMFRPGRRPLSMEWFTWPQHEDSSSDQGILCYLKLFIYSAASGLSCIMLNLSSLTRDQTHVPCTTGQILNHWTTRGVADSALIKSFDKIAASHSFQVDLFPKVHIFYRQMKLKTMLFILLCFLCEKYFCDSHLLSQFFFISSSDPQSVVPGQATLPVNLQATQISQTPLHTLWIKHSKGEINDPSFNKPSRWFWGMLNLRALV